MSLLHWPRKLVAGQLKGIGPHNKISKKHSQRIYIYTQSRCFGGSFSIGPGSKYVDMLLTKQKHFGVYHHLGHAGCTYTLCTNLYVAMIQRRNGEK